jgi:DNA replicative helicase MCM subunit Mcm2 (Cdc46/Mcm family)
MEQQTVTIAKAGIHAALNARCSVVAAANPIYGQYDKSRRPQDNIGLPDSLLSRFDLLFIVLDQMDPYIDRTLSEHVIKSHSYRRPGTIMEPELFHQSSANSNYFNTVDDLYQNQDENNENATPVWLRSNNTNSSSSLNNANAQLSENDLLNKEFLRKYIHYAKMRCKPILSEEASDKISNAYANMRAQQNKKNLPITARTLETMIRLSTAAAKCRLSDMIEVGDVDVAAELLNFVLFHEIGHHQTPQSHNNNNNQQQQQQSAAQTSKTAVEEPVLGSQLFEFNTPVEIAMAYINHTQKMDFDLTEFKKGLIQYSNQRIKEVDIKNILDDLTKRNKVRTFWFSLFSLFHFINNFFFFFSRLWLMRIYYWWFKQYTIFIDKCINTTKSVALF